MAVIVGRDGLGPRIGCFRRPKDYAQGWKCHPYEYLTPILPPATHRGSVKYAPRSNIILTPKMSTKTLENAIRELQKTIATLVNKVDSLEVKLDEQSKIISKLSSISDSDKQKSLANVPPKTDKVPDAALQRNVRAARRNAAAAISEMSSATSRKCSAVRANTPNTTRDINKPSNAPIANLPAVIASSKSACELKSQANVGCVPDKNEQNEWQVVGRQRRNKRPVLVGTGSDDQELKAVEKTRSIQAWNFEPNTTSEKIVRFLNNIVISDYTVEKRKIRTDRHAAFEISMLESIYAQVTAPAVWPPGVRFSEWFPGRSRRPRGDDRESSEPRAWKSSASAYLDLTD